MKSNPVVYILVAITLTSGSLVLLGYFIPPLAGPKNILLEWAVIFSAVLLMVGVVSLIQTHWQRLVDNPGQGTHSLVLLISFFLTLLVAALSGPLSDWSMWLYNNLMVPIESSLLGILAVFLVYACARMFNQRMNFYTLLFIGTILVALAGSLSIPGVDLALVKDVHDWISGAWAVAGARGILLGVALGTVATGLRVLLGADRPYGG